MMSPLLYVLVATVFSTPSIVYGKPPRPACPPANFTSVRNFLVRNYIAAPWYVQKQMPLNYQPINESYCVRVEYELRNNSDVTAGIIVNNYANQGQVNGPYTGSSKYARGESYTLIGVPNTPGSRAGNGKLLVGPDLLQRLLPGDTWRSAFGPYWVVAVGRSANCTIKYDWAIVSGGPPKYEGPNGGCRTLPPGGSTGSGSPQGTWPGAGRRLRQWGGPSGPQNGPSGPRPGSAGPGGPGGSRFLTGFDFGGLWFLSRKPIDPEGTAIMEQKAKDLGFDTSVLVPVQQAGCRYAMEP